MSPRPGRWHDGLLFTTALWTWALTGAWFWTLAGHHGVLLPYVPRVVWAVPGWLWSHHRIASSALLLALTVLAMRRTAGLSVWRFAIVTGLVVTGLVAFVWGGGLLVGLRNASLAR